MEDNPKGARSPASTDLEQVRNARMAEQSGMQGRRNAELQYAAYGNSPGRGSAAGFYLVVAVIGLLVIAVAGVYLTHRQNQQPQTTVMRAPMLTASPLVPSPEIINAPIPHAAPVAAAALSTPAASAGAAAPGTSLLGSDGTASASVPFPVPPAPTPLVGPTVFPNPNPSPSQSLPSANAPDSTGSAFPSTQTASPGGLGTLNSNPPSGSTPQSPSGSTDGLTNPDGTTAPTGTPGGPANTAFGSGSGLPNQP